MDFVSINDMLGWGLAPLEEVPDEKKVDIEGPQEAGFDWNLGVVSFLEQIYDIKWFKLPVVWDKLRSFVVFDSICVVYALRHKLIWNVTKTVLYDITMLFCYLLRRGVVVGPDEELCHDEVLPQSQQGFAKSGIVEMEKMPNLPSLKLIFGH